MSIIMLLGIAADAVQGKARNEILEVINDGLTYDNLMEAFKEIQLDSSKSTSLMSANAVCVEESIGNTISKEYSDRLKEIFGGEVFASQDIVDDVNSWVKTKTKGMIEDAADESVNQVLACLVNAVAFEAEWMEPYEDRDIYEKDFNNVDGTVTQVQMLESTENTYIEDEFFTGFVKPYKDKKYAFMALLPKKAECASFLLRAMKQIDFANLFDNAVCERVHAEIPEFKYDFSKNLTELCRDWGINTLFTPEADFSPMSTEGMMMDSIMHKAHIEVDRKGTKAAAVTDPFLYGAIDLLVGDKFVYLNRPFVYAIMDTETGLPVFAGLYNHAA